MKTKPPTLTLGDHKIFPLRDAQLAVEVAAIREQLSQVCDRVRSSARNEHDERSQRICSHLNDALRDVADALHAALVIEP